MSFNSFSTVGKGAMLGSSFVPAPTNLAYISSTATVSAVTISFSMQSIPGITTYVPSVGQGSGTPSAFIISTLAANSTYSVTLVAKNRGVSSKPSSPALSVTTIPSAPVITYSSVTTNSVVFTFPALSGTYTGTLTYTPYIPGATTGTGGPTGYTIATLASNTNYSSIYLTATNTSGTSAVSNSIAVLTVPGPPTSLTYTSTTSSQIVLSFTPPTGNGTITSYASNYAGSGTSSAWTIGSLSSNTYYSITMTATNASGTSAASSALSVLTVPAAPTSVVATITNATNVSVAFTGDTNTGATITYTVTSSPGSFTATGTASPITVNAAFTSGTSYTFTVSATNTSTTNGGGSATSVTPSGSVIPYVAIPISYSNGLIWTVYNNNFGSGKFMNNSPVGTAGTSTNGVALTIAATNTANWSGTNPAITQNTGSVTDFTSLSTATNSIMVNDSTSHHFSVEWVGYFLANATGTWTFSTRSDDGSWLWIDNDDNQYAYTGYTETNATVKNGPDQGMTTVTGTAKLTSGKYYFMRIQFNENGGGYNIVVSAKKPDDTAVGPDLTGYVFHKADGVSSLTAAPSAAYLSAIGNTTNGTYWINLPTVGATQIYCILDRAVDGGGWMMAMKATKGTTFQYSSSHWTTVTTLSPTDTTRNDADAKFDTMNYYKASDIMALWPDLTTTGGSLYLSNASYSCWSWLQNGFTSAGTFYVGTGNTPSTATAPSGITTAMTLIDWFNKISSLRYFIQDAKTWAGWGNKTMFSSQKDVRFYGFNYLNNSDKKTRWGFGWNENGDNNGLNSGTALSLFPKGDMGSDDVFGGIGMASNNYSAGDYKSCCEDYLGFNRQARVEIYIRDSSQAPSAPTSVSASGSGSTATITFTGSTGASYYTAFSNTGGFYGSSTASPITITGMTTGVTYTFTVKASSALGTSSAVTASGNVAL